MIVLKLKKTKFVPGTIQGLTQSSIATHLTIHAPLPVRGLIDWIHKCLPEIQKTLQPWLTEKNDSVELDEEGIAQWVTRLSSGLQRHLGESVGWGTFLKSDSLSEYILAIPTHNPKLGQIAIQVACRIIREGLKDSLDDPLDKRSPSASLQIWVNHQLKKCVPMHWNTLNVLRTAEHQDIPWLSLTRRIYQLGHGCRAHRTIRSQHTEHTSMIAKKLCQHKPTTLALLELAGFPIPQQGGICKSAEECIMLAEKLGYPVVLKPVASGEGRGVTPGVRTRHDVLKAYEIARAIGQDVWVEKHVEGKDYRLLIVGGRLLTTGCRIAARVTGNGKHTIRKLVRRENNERKHEHLETQLTLDNIAINTLKEAGFSPETILEPGQLAYLRKQTNLSQGGTVEDVTDHVHPDNRLMAERIARIMALDIAGIDFLTTDISRSYLEVGGAINEVNRNPGMKVYKAANPEDSYDGDILEKMYGGTETWRIPIAAVTGISNANTVCNRLHHLLRTHGVMAGLSTTQGIWIGENFISKRGLDGYQGGWILLTDRMVETAIIELPHQGLIDSGCPFDYCDVVALLAIPAPKNRHIEADILKRARHTVVVNAEQPEAVQLIKEIEPLQAKNVIFVGLHRLHPVIKHHLESGATAVLVEAENICLFTEHQHHHIIGTHEIKRTVPDAADLLIDVLFLTAMAHAMGYSPKQIRHELASSHF